MPALFLDRRKPIATCSSTSCQGCPLQSRLQCHFGGKELGRFLAVAFAAFIVGGVGIAQLNAWLLAPWIVFCLGYFGAFEIRALCSHCPHYAEPTRSLQCWANYGSPKLWKYHPGPMAVWEKAVFLGGIAGIFGYPLVILALTAQWALLAAFVVLSLGVGAVMLVRMCPVCMNFSCPLNRVDQATREAFFKRNPVVAKAWGRD